MLFLLLGLGGWVFSWLLSISTMRWYRDFSIFVFLLRFLIIYASGSILYIFFVFVFVLSLWHFLMAVVERWRRLWIAAAITVMIRSG